MHGLEPDCMGSQMRRVAEKKERKGKPVIARCIIIVTKQGCGYEINEYVFYCNVCM
jgi:hypothetical protein